MFNIGITELLVILAIVLVLFGAKRLPDIAKSFGRAVREFKTGINGENKNENPDDKAG